MSTHEKSLTTQSEFQIRHVLIGMAITVVAVVLLVGYLRSFGRSDRSLFFAAGAGVSLGASFFFALVFVPRQLACRRAGAVLLNLEDSVVCRVCSLFRTSFYALLFLFCIEFLSLRTAGKPYVDAPWPLDSLLELGLLGVAATFCFGFVAWPIPDPQLCEHGARWGTVFVPWERQTDVGWSPRDRFTLQIDLKYVGELTIRPALREQVETILRTHATGFIQSPKTSHSKD